MFYEAIDVTGRRSIGVAVSDDGRTNWTRHPAPVLEPATRAGAWDNGGVGAPYAVQMAAGRWRLYYAGTPAAADNTDEGFPATAWRGFGLALSGDGAEQLRGAPLAFARRVA